MKDYQGHSGEFSAPPHEAPYYDPEEHGPGPSYTAEMKNFPPEIVQIIANSTKKLVDLYHAHHVKSEEFGKDSPPFTNLDSGIEAARAEQFSLFANLFEENMAAIVIKGMEEGLSNEEIEKRLEPLATQAVIEGWVAKAKDIFGIRPR